MSHAVLLRLLIWMCLRVRELILVAPLLLRYAKFWPDTELPVGTEEVVIHAYGKSSWARTARLDMNLKGLHEGKPTFPSQTEFQHRWPAFASLWRIQLTKEIAFWSVLSLSQYPILSVLAARIGPSGPRDFPFGLELNCSVTDSSFESEVELSSSWYSESDS